MTPGIPLPTNLPSSLPTSSLPTSSLPTSSLPTSSLPTSSLPTSSPSPSSLPTSLPCVASPSFPVSPPPHRWRQALQDAAAHVPGPAGFVSRTSGSSACSPPASHQPPSAPAAAGSESLGAISVGNMQEETYASREALADSRDRRDRGRVASGSREPMAGTEAGERHTGESAGNMPGGGAHQGRLQTPNEGGSVSESMGEVEAQRVEEAHGEVTTSPPAVAVPSCRAHVAAPLVSESVASAMACWRARALIESKCAMVDREHGVCHLS